MVPRASRTHAALVSRRRPWRREAKSFDGAKFFHECLLHAATLRMSTQSHAQRQPKKSERGDRGRPGRGASKRAQSEEAVKEQDMGSNSQKQ